jgi:hypothetical protein
MKNMPHLLISVIFWAALLAGCVSIDQNFSVDRPAETNPNQNVTEKCPVRPFPCRVIRTMGSAGADILRGGPRGANEQTGFDQVWNVLTVEPGQESYPTLEGTNKPRVDWNGWSVFFLPAGQIENSCRKYAPAKVETDCMSITIYFSTWLTKGPCEAAQGIPVFVYIYPKTNLPIGLLTTDDVDGDGFSNETEVKLGTDPADPKSHP